MIQQALDFRDECDALFTTLNRLEEKDWERKTQFKQWTINDIIAHLHFGDYAADVSLTGNEVFADFRRNMMTAAKQGMNHLAFTRTWLQGIQNRVLLNRWRTFAQEMADRFTVADPKKRVQWFGPDMSVLSSITARLMETWAHGQAIYDLLGLIRQDTNRIKNIAVIGINTFGWTFSNRGLDVPMDKPHVKLTAPSGEIWEWNKDEPNSRITGSAVEFCQVVTQVRNIADTNLHVEGQTATAWMSMAQCFAGPPENPPAPRTRFRQGS